MPVNRHIGWQSRERVGQRAGLDRRRPGAPHPLVFRDGLFLFRRECLRVAETSAFGEWDRAERPAGAPHRGDKDVHRRRASASRDGLRAHE